MRGVGTIAGLDYWTGLLDWTTGLDYWTGLGFRIVSTVCILLDLADQGALEVGIALASTRATLHSRHIIRHQSGCGLRT